MVKTACIQINSGNEPERNIARASELIRAAARDGAEFILTPECVGLMSAGREDLRSKACPEEESQTLAKLSLLAEELGVWLLIGSVAVCPAREEKIRNRSFLLDAEGKVAARYDKIHMYDVSLPCGTHYRESESYTGGDKLVLAETPWGKLGLTVCYDVRFPHLYRNLAQKGAEFIAVPAAFVRYTGEAHWEVLLRARAIENGCYILAPAQTGEHPGGRKTFGHAMIVDPWGAVLADAGVQEGYCMADISTEKVREIRSRIPSLGHDRDFQ